MKPKWLNYYCKQQKIRNREEYELQDIILKDKISLVFPIAVTARKYKGRN